MAGGQAGEGGELRRVGSEMGAQVGRGAAASAAAEMLLLELLG